MEGVFVTGTDTGVGKTTVCAGILKLLYGSKRVAYWKPIQTGTVIGDDTRDVQTLLDLPKENFIEPVYRFVEPLSPFLASTEQGVTVDIDRIKKIFDEKSNQFDFLIVEGAGGIMVPLTKDKLLVELIKILALPVVIVGGNKLGVINSALLTIGACRSANLFVKAVILTKTRKAMNRGNRESIISFGKISPVIEIDETEDRRSIVSQISCHPDLRRLLNIPVLPD